MKKIWITLAGAALLGFTAVHAQEKIQQPSSDYRTTTDQKSEAGTQSWNESDKTNVSQDELPSSLLETLKSDEYQGWENATIYKNKTTNDYMLVLQDQSEVKTFYFDSEGKARPTVGAGSSGTGSYDNNSSGQSSTDTEQDSDLEQSTNEQSSSSNSGLNTTDQSSSSGSATQEESTGASAEYGTTSSESTSGSTMGATGTHPSGSSAGTTTTTGTGPITTPEESETTTTEESSGNTESSSGDLNGHSTSSGELQTTQPDQSNAWRTEDRVIVVMDEVPSGLRVSLEEDRYEGWENSTIYRNRNTNEYMVEIRDGSSTQVHYFDKNGNPIERK